MNEAVLALDGITKSHGRGLPGEVQVLKDATLVIRSGEVVALAGPSGAGKSTLLHIAGLLDTADAGEVHVAGAAMAGLGEHRRTAARRRKIGFVYQFHHLLPEFTALENIILPQLANGIDRSAAEARARALLARVGIAKRADHRPAALSGGEQQRVAFCRALGNSPAIVLADEPTGNLDSATSDKVFDTLMELVHETGLAALIATHDMGLAGRMDRQLRLDAGRIAPA